MTICVGVIPCVSARPAPAAGTASTAVSAATRRSRQCETAFCRTDSFSVPRPSVIDDPAGTFVEYASLVALRS